MMGTIRSAVFFFLITSSVVMAQLCPTSPIATEVSVPDPGGPWMSSVVDDLVSQSARSNCFEELSCSDKIVSEAIIQLYNAQPDPKSIRDLAQISESIFAEHGIAANSQFAIRKFLATRELEAMSRALPFDRTDMELSQGLMADPDMRTLLLGLSESFEELRYEMEGSSLAIAIRNAPGVIGMSTPMERARDSYSDAVRRFEARYMELAGRRLGRGTSSVDEAAIERQRSIMKMFLKSVATSHYNVVVNDQIQFNYNFSGYMMGAHFASMLGKTLVGGIGDASQEALYFSRILVSVAADTREDTSALCKIVEAQIGLNPLAAPDNAGRISTVLGIGSEVVPALSAPSAVFDIGRTLASSPTNYDELVEEVALTDAQRECATRARQLHRTHQGIDILQYTAGLITAGLSR